MDVAGSDRDRLDAALVAGEGGVDRVLGEDHRVVVGEGHRLGAVGDRRCGDAVRARASSRRSMSFDFEMSQFWQNLHARLQPAVPNDRMADPGKKWLSGFFSIGSMQKPDERP
jgi:hypothetical protein